MWPKSPTLPHLFFRSTRPLTFLFVFFSHNDLMYADHSRKRKKKRERTREETQTGSIAIGPLFTLLFFCWYIHLQSVVTQRLRANFFSYFTVRVSLQFWHGERREKRVVCFGVKKIEKTGSWFRGCCSREAARADPYLNKTEPMLTSMRKKKWARIWFRCWTDITPRKEADKFEWRMGAMDAMGQFRRFHCVVRTVVKISPSVRFALATLCSACIQPCIYANALLGSRPTFALNSLVRPFACLTGVPFLFRQTKKNWIQGVQSRNNPLGDKAWPICKYRFLFLPSTQLLTHSVLSLFSKSFLFICLFVYTSGMLVNAGPLTWFDDRVISRG
jgi:hypothetical protein